jgi:UDP:flavonoid glycosyltransferase YjiC (YdhE family)
MSKIIYLTPPAHGHVNPALPVMRELVQRGDQVICYNIAEFRPQIEGTGATFRAYPTTEMTAAEISKLLQHGNIANMTGLILRTTEQLLNARCVAARGAGQIIDDYVRHKPITAGALRQALATVSSEPRYREAAQGLRRSLRATGGYQQAADEIQAYVAGGLYASTPG